MINKAYFTNLLFSIFFLSCGNNDDFDNLAKIKKGMTIKEVNNIMGVPDSSFVDPADTTQINYRYNGSLGMSDDMYIYFYASDSTVKYIYDGR